MTWWHLLLAFSGGVAAGAWVMRCTSQSWHDLYQDAEADLSEARRAGYLPTRQQPGGGAR